MSPLHQGILQTDTVDGHRAPRWFWWLLFSSGGEHSTSQQHKHQAVGDMLFSGSQLYFSMFTDRLWLLRWEEPASGEPMEMETPYWNKHRSKKKHPSATLLSHAPPCSASFFKREIFNVCDYFVWVYAYVQYTYPVWVEAGFLGTGVTGKRKLGLVWIETLPCREWKD